jgi:hypothetical protein
MTVRRPLLETVARSICRASGADHDQPVFRNGHPESGVLYLKWELYRDQAKAAIEACQVAQTRKVLEDVALRLAEEDDQESRIIRERIAKLLEKLGLA